MIMLIFLKSLLSVVWTSSRNIYVGRYSVPINKQVIVMGVVWISGSAANDSSDPYKETNIGPIPNFKKISTF